MRRFYRYDRGSEICRHRAPGGPTALRVTDTTCTSLVDVECQYRREDSSKHYMTAMRRQLLPGICVVERGWLNCDQILLSTPAENVLIDSGYGRHAAPTLRHAESAVAGRHNNIGQLVNTHCNRGQRRVAARK